MNDLIALGLTLAGISLIVGLLEYVCRPVKFHDLTRSADYLDQVDRQQNVELSIAAYDNRLSAAGIGKVRNVREVSHV